MKARVNKVASEMAKSVEVYKQMQHNAEIQQYISPPLKNGYLKMAK
jgi:hypothetical protein